MKCRICTFKNINNYFIHLWILYCSGYISNLITL